MEINESLPSYVNPQLVWDYSLTPAVCAGEAFEQWYVARVLVRGTLHDLERVGLSRIRHHLPTLTLPRDVKAFWEWYLSS